MMAAIGLVSIIGSFKSTKIDSAMRNMAVAKVIHIELASQVLSLIVTVILAWRLQSPWALLWGNVFSAAISAVFSHTYLPGNGNRFAWSPKVIRDIWGFSSWVLVGSTITFLSGEGLNLLRAKIVSLEFLGQLGIATTLSLVAWSAVQKVAGRVLFPAYAETMRESPDRLADVVKKSKRVMLFMLWPTSMALVLFAPWIIGNLYDSRYEQSVILMQIMSAGMLVAVLNSCYVGIFDALGKPHLSTYVVAVEAVVRGIGIIVGHYYLGEIGVVIGVAVVTPVIYIIGALVYRSFGIRDGLFDFIGFVLFILAFAWVFFVNS
jgi:O-antigen/teichoic acid export membrane protein